MAIENNIELLKENTDDVVSKLIESQDIEEIKRLTQLFNVNQMKKDAIRVIKLNDILDKLDNQVSERVEKYPDQFSNIDLLKYVDTIQQTINKSNQTITNINQTPLIQLNQQNNIVQVSEDALTRESREKIVNIVKQFLENSQKSPEVIDIKQDEVVYYNNEEEEQ